MLTPRAILLCVAVFCFILAAFPRPSMPPVHWEWLAAALIVLAWLA